MCECSLYVLSSAMKTFIFLSSNGEVCHALLAPAAKLAKRSVRRANVLVVRSVVVRSE